MSTPITWAQEVITCDICNDAAYQFCNSCQIKLCGNCINKHVNAHKLLPHDIVPFTNRSVKEVNLQCEIHPGQKCEACCQQCDVMVCMKCVITSHQSHRIGEIPSDYHDNRKKIVLETEELQKLYDLEKHQSDVRVSNVKEKISKTTQKFDELEIELAEPRKQWHQEVDEIFDKHRELIKSMKDKALKSLTEQIHEPNSMTQRMLETLKENKAILRSKTVSKVVNYKSKLQEYKAIGIPEDINVTIPSLKVNTDRGKELIVEFGELKASLTQKLLFDETNENTDLSSTVPLSRDRMVTDIQIPFRDLNPDAVACTGSDEAWMSGRSRKILRFHVNGSLKESVTVSSEPADISVTQQGELIYTDYVSETVNIVRSGLTKELIKAPKGWAPLGLCCTNSGDILVNMATYDFNNHKIVRYEGQKVIQEIEKDSYGIPLYRGGNFKLYIAENRNGDICASDGNAKKVVVVDEKGKVRFLYNGDVASRKKYFCPEQIATDSWSQIIVTDHNNDCLHILDENGHFLRCLDNCGLDTPGGLSVDNKGRCWVGSYSGKLKVISLKM
ncbi:E3 ubiquitin-protein ligase TRIM71-like [Saccostrea echinata]|uniref:E3 ubiquitin-protein ligase TRIM71-like n=1 Tax=Saccostrea echinata TaxID=191078 RepID=UPI002A7F966A|nr:E3 ubiquitin-protein ligase TRIM71-like [Saccostrea echinata]